MSSHIKCCSRVEVGEVHVFSITRHKRLITFIATNWTLDEANATKNFKVLINCKFKLMN